MSSQTSQQALQVLEQTEFVITSTLTQKPVISAELRRIFADTGGEGEGNPVPDWDQLQDSHVTLLRQSAAEVRRTDQDHRVNLIQARQLRRQRRRRIDALKDHHRDLRQSFTGTYGEESLPFVGLDAAPEIRFVAVREQAKEVLERMRDPQLASRVGAPRSGQVALDVTPLADALEVEINQVGDVTQEIQQLRKRLDESLLAKREALKAHRRVYINVTRIQEGYYRLAGRDELAKRIRSPEPPRRSASQEDADSGSEGTEPDESGPAPSEPEAASPVVSEEEAES